MYLCNACGIRNVADFRPTNADFHIALTEGTLPKLMSDFLASAIQFVGTSCVDAEFSIPARVFAFCLTPMKVSTHTETAKVLEVAQVRRTLSFSEFFCCTNPPSP